MIHIIQIRVDIHVLYYKIHISIANKEIWPPTRRGIEYFVYALQNSKFRVFCPNSANFRWLNLVETAKRRYPHAKTFNLHPLPRLYNHTFQRNNLENLMFKIIAALGNFGRIWPTSGIQIWLKLPKAHLPTNTFHLHPLHPLQRNNLEKLMF